MHVTMIPDPYVADVEQAKAGTRNLGREGGLTVHGRILRCRLGMLNSDVVAVFIADAKVMADITVSNTGNTRISNITLSSSNWTNITCACSASENITQLVPGESQQCTANITFTQDLFEAVAVGASSGRLATQLTAAAAGSPSVGNITALLDVMTQYAASVEVNIDSCTVPDARECCC